MDSLSVSVDIPAKCLNISLRPVGPIGFCGSRETCFFATRRFAHFTFLASMQGFKASDQRTRPAWDAPRPYNNRQIQYVKFYQTAILPEGLDRLAALPPFTFTPNSPRGQPCNSSWPRAASGEGTKARFPQSHRLAKGGNHPCNFTANR